LRPQRAKFWPGARFRSKFSVLNSQVRLGRSQLALRQASLRSAPLRALSIAVTKIGIIGAVLRFFTDTPVDEEQLT
jgi:hypothetical protein